MRIAAGCWPDNVAAAAAVKSHIQILWDENPGERYRPEAPSAAPEAPSDVCLKLHIQILWNENPGGACAPEASNMNLE